VLPLSSRVNSSKIFSWSSGEMAQALVNDRDDRMFVLLVDLNLDFLAGRLALRALESRLYRICLTRLSSASTMMCSGSKVTRTGMALLPRGAADDPMRGLDDVLQCYGAGAQM